MGSLKIVPRRLKGNVNIPPSKSMAHRAVICAALSAGECIISNINLSDDIKATIKGMISLGADINILEGNKIRVIGAFNNENADKIDKNAIIDCNESGSTLRFLVPISLLFDGVRRFVGRGNLGKRPLTTYYEIFDRQGIQYSAIDGELDLRVKGRLQGDDFYVRGDVSSQFISGLMFTLPLLERDSRIIITTELESKGYLDLTIDCMKKFGIEIENNNYKEFIIKGNQRYVARDYTVEGDYSQGAFFLCANAIENQVIIKGLDENSLQGDKEIVDILKRMGSFVGYQGDILVNTCMDGLKPTVVDASQCPDIIPVLTVALALAEGKSTVINAGRLRIKECDRLAAVATELNKLGAKIIEQENGLIIEGVKNFIGEAEVWSWKDHRIAMMLAIAATRCENPIILKDWECVAKSYPHFFEDYNKLGGEVHEWSLGK